MRTLSAFLLCWIACYPAVVGATTPPAQGPKPTQAAPAQSTGLPTKEASGSSTPGSDPAKETAIRNMFEVMGTKKMMEQVIAGMSANVKPMMMSSLPPGDYREKLVDLFFQRFQTKLRVELLLDLAVPVYDKYFSKEEIEGLTRFYQTPLGKKALSVMPQSLIEIQTASMNLGEKFGRESMAEVLDENPDLKKALEEAASAPKN